MSNEYVLILKNKTDKETKPEYYILRHNATSITKEEVNNISKIYFRGSFLSAVKLAFMIASQNASIPVVLVNVDFSIQKSTTESPKKSEKSDTKK